MPRGPGPHEIHFPPCCRTSGAPFGMKSRRGFLLAATLLVLGVAARLHNAWVFPVLGGYDAYSHFAYIRYVAETGRVPLPTEGWSYFHPPLYYALMAGLWNLLDRIEPLLRLRIGTVILAAAGCLQAAILWRIVRRRFPDEPVAATFAAGFLLLVPVGLYTAGFLGNEGLNAVLAGFSFAALLALLDRPGLVRAAILGACLGLAMLTKFSAFTVAAAALLTIGLQGIVRGRIRSALASLAVVSIVAAAICGPFYLRNVSLYGNPFQLSRDIPIVAYVEGNQPRAARSLAEYVTFDPLIFWRPSWPRGSAAMGDDSSYGFARSVRESVPTGLYASTWFDASGGWVLPPVTDSEMARRAGQALLILGLLPTGLVCAGFLSGLRSLRREGWDDALAVFTLATVLMLAGAVRHSLEAPIAAAVKASYLAPATLAFGFWFALGFVGVRRRWPQWSGWIAAGCTLAGVASLVVFWQGFVFDPREMTSSLPRYDASRLNQYGIVEMAGGRRDEARRLFTEAAASDYHLAIENLGFLAIDEGRARDGLKLLVKARRLQRQQVDGGPIGSAAFLASAEAEYDHSIAVVLHGLGRTRRAEALWARAIAAAPQQAESVYGLAVSRLDSAIAAAGRSPVPNADIVRARESLAGVRQNDPGLREAWTASAMVEALAGDCAAAARLQADGERVAATTPRRYPAGIGDGSGLSASIGRRRLVAPSRALLDAVAAGPCSNLFANDRRPAGS